MSDLPRALHDSQSSSLLPLAERLAYDREMVRCRVAVLVLILSVTGCTKKNPLLVCPGGTCSDPQFPFCDADGAISGEPGTCIAVSCAPNTFVACDGDNVITCDQVGTNYDTQHCVSGCNDQLGACNACQPNMSACGADGTLHVCDAQGIDTPVRCAAGCIDAPAPHCAYVSPHYLPGACDGTAQGSLNIASDQTLDTSMDATCNGGIVQQIGAPDICVVRYATLSVSPTAVLRVIASTMGTNVKNRPIAFIVDGDLVIDGELDAAARGPRSSSQSSGPGGGYVSEFNGDLSTGGAGGAGFATTGGSGGNTVADGGAQNGGAQLPNPLTSVFEGGPSSPGGGGGGVMLVSCHGTVKISGVVSLGGGGGISGYISTFCFPGSGGGAGGSLLVEGMNVEITGSLFANGGGGGAGCAPGTQATSDQHGADGPLSDTTAAAGGIAVTGAGSGGAGGIGPNAPGDGRRSTVSGDHPGGGGGSIGWLQVGVPNGVTPSVTPLHASPPVQVDVPVSVR
ncbi:MAG: hypothetical protein ACM31C_11070 [Acidobacteriota bacterium]